MSPSPSVSSIGDDILHKKSREINRINKKLREVKDNLHIPFTGKTRGRGPLEHHQVPEYLEKIHKIKQRRRSMPSPEDRYYE